jgi:hypothetical protein
METRSPGNPVRLFASSLLFLGSSLSLALVSPPARAAACRDIATVQQSAVLTANTGMGGHVAQHVLGMQPPSGTSQVGKTLFSDNGKFNDAWSLYTRVTNPRSCSGSHVLQVFDLGHPIDAFSCRKADGNGKCTEWDSFYATEVAFGFVRQSNGVWILNTAYPLPRQ